MCQGYSDAEVEAIGGWLREGLSGSQICVEFGRRFRHVTRNAIIGVVHRDRRLKAIGFMARAGRSTPSTPRAKAPPKPKIPRSAFALRPPPAPVSIAVVKEPEQAPVTALAVAAKLLADLEWRECRWPVNDARPGEDHLFCAGPRDPWGGPYCAAHTQLAGAGYTAGQKLGQKIARAA